MNLKNFFYKEYYTNKFEVEDNGQFYLREANIHKPDNKEAFKVIKKYNASVFAKANDHLKNFTLQNADKDLLKVSLRDDNRPVAVIPLYTVYPGLLIGTGYTHETNNEGEFKLGFYFDHSTGLPTIPGSSVKGVMRSVFPQLKSQHPFILPTEADGSIKMDDKQAAKVSFVARLFDFEADSVDAIWKVHQLELAIFEGVDLALTKLAFDKGKKDVEYLSIYHRTLFFHGYISDGDNSHKILDIDSITPHNENPLKNPIPLPFLKIRSDVRLDFQFSITAINYLNISTDMLYAAFKAILITMGVGAKTNVGYGQLESKIKPLRPIVFKQPDVTAASQQAAPGNSILDEIKEPLPETKRLLENTKRWAGKIVKIKKDNSIIQIEAGNEAVLLKKKIQRIPFEVKVGDSVIVDFISKYTYPTPDFQVLKGE